MSGSFAKRTSQPGELLKRSWRSRMLKAPSSRLLRSVSAAKADVLWSSTTAPMPMAASWRGQQQGHKPGFRSAAVEKEAFPGSKAFIRRACQATLPGWSEHDPEDILIETLPVGTSNKNYKVSLQRRVDPQCVLFRAITSKGLYDPKFEQWVFNMLSAYGIAPRMYAMGPSWRIEQWYYAVPLSTTKMRDPSILTQVAAGFAQLHKLSQRPDFPEDLQDLKPLSLERLESWGGRAAELRDLNPDHPRGRDLCLDEMLAERAWLEHFLLEEESPELPGRGLDIIFSHCDGQENNILETQSGLRFIDFEYSGMDFQAFDIASYFVECTIDYMHDTYPFYKVDPTAFPTDEEQRLFASVYLAQYLQMGKAHAEIPSQLANQHIDALLRRTQRFILASHLLWSFWSVIRVYCSRCPPGGGFDYAHYARCRWMMYKMHKQKFLDRRCS